MNGPIYQFFAQDHNRVDDILQEAIKDSESIDFDKYQEFRIALLTHIKMEENILFPAAKEANAGKELPDFKRFRLEHAAITTLLAVHPNVYPEVIKVIRYILERHDEAEEKPGGMYEVCEKLTENRTKKILQQLKNTIETPVHPPKKEDYVLAAAKRVVERAGYNYDEIANL